MNHIKNTNTLIHAREVKQTIESRSGFSLFTLHSKISKEISNIAAFPRVKAPKRRHSQKESVVQLLHGKPASENSTDNCFSSIPGLSQVASKPITEILPGRQLITLQERSPNRVILSRSRDVKRLFAVVVPW